MHFFDEIEICEKKNMIFSFKWLKIKNYESSGKIAGLEAAIFPEKI